MKIRYKNRSRSLSEIGFTMVELLAVLVIILILSAIFIAAVSNLINIARDDGKVSDKKMLELSAKSYIQNNSDKLPKVVGTSTIIKATTLKDSNYLKQDLIDSNGDSCMENSVVRVYKVDNKKYTYNSYIYCKGDEIPSEIEGVKPEVEVTFMDQKGNKQKPPEEGVNTDVKSAVVQIKYKGGKTTTKEDIGLAGYSYIISVKYKNNVDDSTEGKYVEISNSGTLNASGRTDITVKKNISKFIDITKASNIRVTVQANNEDGGSFKGTFDSNYYDSVAPECGEITGEAGENEWDRTVKKRTITVRCLDGDGSGCIKDSFTKTFNTETEDGYITIRDNANNTARCKVRVHLDWTAPTLTINAYKRNANGTPGTLVGTAIANERNKNVTLRSYTGAYGNDNWLNKANYPNGVYYEVISRDNMNNSTGIWSINAEGLTKSSSEVKNVTENAKTSFTDKSNKTNFSITEDGYRYGVYKLKDRASNEATISITAALDRKEPTVPSVSLFRKNSGTDISSSLGLAPYQNDTWLNGWVFTQAINSTDDMSGLNHYEYTTTGATANATNATGEYRNINAQGSSYIAYKAVDNAGNNSSSTAAYTVRLDRTAPTITASTVVNETNNLNLTITDNIGLDEYVVSTTTTPPSTGWKKISGISHTETLTKKTGKYYIHAKDLAGNLKTSQQLSINADPTFGKYLRETKTRGFNSTELGRMYRYTGSTANNYVCFGTASKSTCLANKNAYMFRVIGVVKTADSTMGTSKDMVKIISENTNYKFKWNDTNADVLWSASGVRKGINKFPILGDYDSKIANISWRHGKSFTMGKSATQAFNTEKAWTRTSKSKIAVMYVSDYLYATGNSGQVCTDTNGYDTCKGTWIHKTASERNKTNFEWTMNYADTKEIASYSAIIIRTYTVERDHEGALFPEVEPVPRRSRAVFYLKEKVYYRSGSGTQSDPFIVS